MDLYGAWTELFVLRPCESAAEEAVARGGTRAVEGTGDRVWGRKMQQMIADSAVDVMSMAKPRGSEVDLRWARRMEEVDWRVEAVWSVGRWLQRSSEA